MYFVLHTVYHLHCTLFAVFCIFFNLYSIYYYVLFTLYTVWYSVYSLFCILYFLLCIVWYVYCALYSVLITLHSLDPHNVLILPTHTLYSFLCTLYSVFKCQPSLLSGICIWMNKLLACFAKQTTKLPSSQLRNICSAHMPWLCLFSAHKS